MTCLLYTEKVYISLFKYCKSMTLILRVSFGANQPLNYLD
jgi:hypothetical protein